MNAFLAALGAGKPLAEAAGTAESEAAQRWADECRRRLPPANASLKGRVYDNVEVLRDSYGVPHIYASIEPDLFFGLGYAMAQDRLWLMDYLRRKATGRLAELLGEGYLEQDLLYRTLDFTTVCTREEAALAPRWRDLLAGMAGGINLSIANDPLPIEFDILGYRPEPWTAADILIGLRYQWWGLSGRLFQITTATLLDRELGDRVDAFTKAERDDLYIVPDGLNAGAATGDPARVKDSLHLGDGPHGSNNWVIGGKRTRTGKPLLANDPHYNYAHAHGNFYPCHLDGAGHSEAGFVFLGTPGMMTGRNDRIAWGFTNNGVTLRDLYATPADARVSSREVEIGVKGQAAAKRSVRTTVHGPIVDDVIPAGARQGLDLGGSLQEAKVGAGDGRLALRWIGFERIDDVQSLVEMNTATDWRSFRAALSNWACSATNFIYGDVEDNVGYQLSARIPLRRVSTRGIRRAGDAGHEWQGYIPFDGNPRLENPPDGIVATANQRPINPSYRWPIYGAYAGGTRQARILEVLRAKSDHDSDDFRRMQFDTTMIMARESVPTIVAALRGSDLADLGEALAAWDFVARTGTIAPTLFEMFMDRWTPAYATAAGLTNPTVRGAAGPAARRELVGEDKTLPEGRLNGLIVETMRAAVARLTELFGDDRAGWLWGKVHDYAWPHPLGGIGALGSLLNGPRLPCAGTQNVINNVAPSHEEPFIVASGPTYRLIADLADPSAVLINSHCPQSARPGSPHYADTIRDWAQGNYQRLSRDRAMVEVESEGRTVIQPT